MNNKNNIPMEKKKQKKKKDSDKAEHREKEHIKKKNDVTKKKLTLGVKDKIESKNKNENDMKKKNEKENEEKKKIANDTKKRNENDSKTKIIGNDKKNYPLKNNTPFDITVLNKEKENLSEVKGHHKNVNSLISRVNIDLEKDVNNVVGIDLVDEMSSLIFNDSNAVVINKNYLFTLAQKYLGSEEYLLIKNSLTKYKLDDVLIFKNIQIYYKKNHALVVDEEIFSYFLKKNKNSTDGSDQNDRVNCPVENSEDKEELSCIFIKPKNYISLYEEEIEKEINSTNVTENRKKFKKYIYISKKKKKEVKYEFTDYDNSISIKDNTTPNSTVQERTLDFCSKNSIILREKSCQTYKTVYKNLGVQYNIDFLKKKKEEIMKSNKLQKFLHNVFPIIEKFIIENVIIIEKNAQPNIQSMDILSFKNIKNLNKIFIYTDVKYTTDKVVLFTLYLSLINYLIFIIYINNYSNDSFIEGVNTDSYILVWSYTNYINPLYALISPYQISSAVVNDKGYDLVIAGCSNGLLVIWKLPPNFYGTSILHSKINKKTVDIEPYLFSSIEYSHKREVTTLIFLNDKNLILSEKKISINNQKNSHLLVSISVDGTILIWDATNIEKVEVKNNTKKKEKELTDELYSFKPLFKINTTRPNTEYSLGFTYFHFIEINSHVSSFFAFSEEGEYIIGNMYGCMQKEKNYSIISKINDDYKSFKTLLCVKRNRIIKYLILTLTDTNFYLWKENEEHPLYASPKSNEIYSCCEFSHTKISVIFIGKINGHIEIWNLLEQKNHCICSLSISSYSLTCISIFYNFDSNLFNNMDKKTKVPKVDNDLTTYENFDEVVDTNEYLMSKNEDDVYMYSYNKIIIGDSSGCVFVYEMEESLLNSSKDEIDEFLLWVENRIFVNKQKVKRQLELCEEKEKMKKKKEKNTNERKEQLKAKLDEDYKNVLEKYKSYLLGNKI
ncbi:dynein intermediate chain, putative [Plasmodium malariae]|uniref:Dynein intermediate chain, putative n=1 Tax=Plasmodium malariae TaxID=5858 RepID=A0A1D3RJT3_PLAMA|nr:dynein intermediate chain, putative [Plasmodium malariae]SCN45268.1 dynein intermediate chain, putative [Plasmodium malariae]